MGLYDLIFGSHRPRLHRAEVVILSLSILIPLVHFIASNVDITGLPGGLFLFLFLFRYVRLVVNTISWALARPYPRPARPTYKPNDCTVVIPTANPKGDEFIGTVNSALRSDAAQVIIVTFGQENMESARAICAAIPDPRLSLVENPRGNKREQMMRGVRHVSTRITVFCDDHVFWPRGFLESVLAPFEDPCMGGVGMHKRVHREYTGSLVQNFLNFLGCIYLARHNAEILATNRLDGGVFIISSRTSLFRTSILKDQGFREGFLNEYIFGAGPLVADDDNFIMRWLVEKRWKMWIQNGPEALMETTINNSWTKFRAQLLRWCRTTWRSNPRSIVQIDALVKTPWSYYATLITLFVNFALLWDFALLYTVHCAAKNSTVHLEAVQLMAVWIIGSKLVKLAPHMLRHPLDICFFPGYIVFAYFHSFLKLWSMLTFRDIGWGSRTNVDDNRRPVGS